MKLRRRSWSISSSSRPSSIAASTSRSVMICETRATMSSATSRHPLHGRPDLVGHGEVGHPQPGDLGDVHRQVAHPLQLADHPQRRDDDPQVAGDRLLQGEQEERGVLDPLAGAGRSSASALITCSAISASPVSSASVASADGGLDAAADAGQVVEDGVELFVEGLAHGADPRQRQVTRRGECVNDG